MSVIFEPVSYLNSWAWDFGSLLNLLKTFSVQTALKKESSTSGFSLTHFVPLGTKILCCCVLKNRFLGSIQRDLKSCSNFSSTFKDFTQNNTSKPGTTECLCVCVCVRVCVRACVWQRNKQIILRPAVIPYLCLQFGHKTRKVSVQYHGQVLSTLCMTMETTYSESSFCCKQKHRPASVLLY